MIQPKVTRPYFPKGYVDNHESILSWNHVEQRLSDAINYWICSVRPDGRPHAIPIWAVFVNDKIYFDGSPETRHARNIDQNPYVVLHLENGSDVVIVEGEVAAVQNPSPEMGEDIAGKYSAKYAELGYSPELNQWDGGGLFEITVHMAMAWTEFNRDPTKFVFEIE